MLKQFFGFKAEPFPKDIDTNNIFLSNSVKELTSRLEYIKKTRGLMLLTGDPGTGKSLALRRFVNSLSQSSYLVVYTPMTTVSAMEFYRQTCFMLTDEIIYHKWRCFHKIQAGVRELVANSKKVPVIILDEAQLLRPETLHEIQLLLNFDIDSVDPVVFILCAQSFFRDTITRPVFASLNQRFSMKYNIPGMDREETTEYIAHHLKLAGGKNDLFTPQSVEAIFNNTGGIPRLVGNLCKKALELAAIERKQNITEEEIYSASKEM